MDTEDVSAIIGSTKTVRTSVDGGMSITFDIAPTDMLKAFALFGTPGTTVGIARVTVETAKKEAQKQSAASAPSSKGPYGDSYTLLYQRGFFNNPNVRAAFGKDGTSEEAMKKRLYEQFDVASLAAVRPADFLKYMRALGIARHVPNGFGE